MIEQKLRTLSIAVSLAAFVALGSAADWPMTGGNPQHNGWARSERQIERSNVGLLKLLYKFQSDNQSKGFSSLTAPIIDGNLITFRGFKEMLMFTGSAGTVFSIDADLNHLLWETHLPDSGVKTPIRSISATCSDGMTAPLITAGSSSSALRFAALASQAPVAAGVPRTRRNPYLPPLAQSLYPLLPTTLTQLNAVYTVSADGYLHVINSSTGQDLLPAVRFVPPHAAVTNLNLRDNVVYATTATNCDGYRNTLYALDLLSPEKTIHMFSPAQGEFAGSSGTTIGDDGTVYVQSTYSPDGGAQHEVEAVVALTPKEVKVKDYFILGHKVTKNAREQSGITPVVFSWGGRDVLVAARQDGRVYMLDSKSLGGTDHKTPLFVSTAVVKSREEGSGLRGAFATWLDAETGIRRLYAPVFGGVRPSSGFTTGKGSQSADVIVAWALQGSPSALELQPLWTSTNLAAPAPPVIANGMVFVLSTGDPSHLTTKKDRVYSIQELQQLAQPATLQVFDAGTGKSLYSGPGAPVSSPLSAGLALANGRLYFTARDNAVYCFGIPGQQSQLTEQ